MSKPANTTQSMTDIELKDHGNKLFAARKFEDAVSCYSKAIVSEKQKTKFSSQIQ
jgi:STIP1 homology and U-box containing protein 1